MSEPITFSFAVEVMSPDGTKGVFGIAAGGGVVSDALAQREPYHDDVCRIIRSQKNLPRGFFRLRQSGRHGWPYEIVEGKSGDHGLQGPTTCRKVFKRIGELVFHGAKPVAIRDIATPPDEGCLADVRSFFPDELGEPLTDRINRQFKFVHGLPFPRKRTCAFCSEELIIRNWRFFRRTKQGTGQTARCDVFPKCSACAMTPTAGLVISEKHLARFGEDRTFTWRQGKEYLRAEDERTLRESIAAGHVAGLRCGHDSQRLVVRVERGDGNENTRAECPECEDVTEYTLHEQHGWGYAV